MYSRRVLVLHFQQVYYRPPPPLTTTQTTTTSSLDKAYSTSSNGFNANVVMVLSVLLCALFCSLGLNSLIRCTLRCSSFINRAPSTDTALDTENPLPVGAGVTKKALKAFPTVSFRVDDESLQNSDCVICLSEFVAGDKVRLLPKCNHGFHVRCIDKWLNSHSSCPTCRSSLVVHNSPDMVVGGCTPLAASSSPDPQPQPSRLDSVAPLERESMIHTTTY